jgi:hypothetical protein
LANYSFQAVCNFNHIYILESLVQGGTNSDLRTAHRLYEDILIPLSQREGFLLDFIEIKSKQDFLDAFGRILMDSMNGHFPLVHIDMHGDDGKGLEINPTKEWISWDEFKALCRGINIASHNNLPIILASCFGLNSINSVSMYDVTPYYLLVGSQKRVPAGFIDSSFRSFYSEIFASGDIDLAVANISDYYGMYLSEKLFATAMINYFKAGCKGKGRTKRIEDLLTKVVNGGQSARYDLKAARRKLKQAIKVDGAVFDRYASRVLMYNHPSNLGRFSITFQSILDFLNKNASR